MLSSTNPPPVVASLRLASSHGRQPSFLRLRSALRCSDSFTKYFYGRKACTLLGKASVSNFTVSHSPSSSEKHRLWPVCWLFLASWLPLRSPPPVFVQLLCYSYLPFFRLAPYCYGFPSARDTTPRSHPSVTLCRRIALPRWPMSTPWVGL